MVEFEKLKAPAQTEMDRAMELAKVEAFDYWIDGKPKQKSKSQPKPCYIFKNFQKSHNKVWSHFQKSLNKTLLGYT